MVVPESCQLGISAGMAALQVFYNLSTGLWNTTEWWNAANALETTIDYSIITNTQTYTSNIFHTYHKHKHKNFLNPWFHDDDGWWALTWIKAYDLTGEPRYLDAAKTIFNDMKRGWDSTCGGGIWWKKKEKTYKNTITNEQFLSVAARLHLRTPGDGGPDSYLDWAQRSWNWLKNSGLINQNNLVNDGLNSACQNNGQTTWTYNQGVILGGLVDLYKSTKDAALLTQAEAIADAAIRELAPNGILREPCEPNCGADGPQFKGIFIRNLSYLYQTVGKPTYKNFIIQNANSIWAQNRNQASQFGLSWAGPFDKADAARQSAALDAVNAAIRLETKGITYQAETALLHGLPVEATELGYRGEGYVANWSRGDQSVTFNVTVACSGKYDLVFRYAAAKKDAARYLHVNGKRIVSNQIFPKTGSWSQWSQVVVPKVWLNAGGNTVSVLLNPNWANDQWLNLDEITIQ